MDASSRRAPDALTPAADLARSHGPREALIDAGIALSRTITLEGVYHAVGQQLRRAGPFDAVAIAWAADPASWNLVFHTGFDVASRDIEQRLGSSWRDALASGAVVSRPHGEGLQLTAPMVSSGRLLGAMTLVSAQLENSRLHEEAVRVVTTIADQTAAAIERVRTVNAVEHKRRLEAIGEVAGGVAQELRNPLFGISSAAQLLRFRAREDPVVEKNVGRILREVERLNRMASALLEYGRPHPLRLAPGDPDAAWDDVLEDQRGRLESGGLQLRRTRAAPPARCAIDPEQLAQVFVGILLNAIEAAPPGSELSLASSRLPDSGWECRLHNGGPLISPDVLSRVFEIFYSTKPGSAGIGLALCQRIVEGHGGTIALESAPTSGTICTITLPGAGGSTPNR